MPWGQFKAVLTAIQLKNSPRYANDDFLRKVFTKWVFNSTVMNVNGYQSHTYLF